MLVVTGVRLRDDKNLMHACVHGCVDRLGSNVFVGGFTGCSKRNSEQTRSSERNHAHQDWQVRAAEMRFMYTDSKSWIHIDVSAWFHLKEEARQTVRRDGEGNRSAVAIVDASSVGIRSCLAFNPNSPNLSRGW